jgi:hypothetical protein
LYFAQALKRQLVMATGFSCDPLRVMKMGPESRIQIRFVGH